MKKTDKIFIVAAILIIPIIATIYFALSSQYVFSQTTSSDTALSSSNSSNSNNNNSKNPTIVLGSPVIIGKGNISAAAVDSHSGRIYVAYYKTLNNASDIYISHSDNNGTTFSSPIRVNDIVGDATADDTSPPVIKVASNGTVFVSWPYTDFNKYQSKFIYGYITLRIAHSTDGGNTFSKAAHLEPQDYGKFTQTYQDLGISPDSKTVYIAWINANGTKGTFNDIVTMAKSTDGGNTFSKGIPVDAENPACSCCKINMALDSKGDIYTSWRKLYATPNEATSRPLDNNSEYRQIVVAKSLDDARTFATPVKVYDDKFLTNQCVMSGPQMAIDNKNNLHIVWYTGSNTTGFTPGAYYAVSSNGGKNFSKPIPIVASNQLGASVEHMAIDSNNNSWITWDDRSGQNNTAWMY